MKNYDAFIAALKSATRGGVLNDEYSRGLYATDASIYQIAPIAILTPLDREDVRNALRIADEYEVSILPRGGGTSLAGQTVGHSLVLDFSRHMNRILEINVDEQWAIVEPGINRDDLNAALLPHNLHFAPDPATSSRANIGGMIGNNSSGTKSILYGKTIDHTEALTVMLADGEDFDFAELSPEDYKKKADLDDREGTIYREFAKIVQANETAIDKNFPKVMRRVGGYCLDEFTFTDRWNLSKLFVGSEGTLGLTMSAKINLTPLPKYKALCVAHFTTLKECISAVHSMLAFQPSAIEIVDNTVIELSRKNLTTMRSCHFIEGDPAAILIVEFFGDTEASVMERPQQMIELLKSKNMGYAYPVFPEGQSFNDVWTIRKKGLGLMLGMKSDRKPTAFVEDASIPTEVLPDYIAEVKALCDRVEVPVAMYAHASVGVIHVRPILDLRLQSDIDKFKIISEEVFQLVKKYRGSLSGEHGDGLVRSPYNERFFGKEVYQAFKQVKTLFDPKNRMNPGKIVDAPPIDENLRYGTSYKDGPVNDDTVFKFRRDGSFTSAVHMCNGVGECRKMISGTMCPSFKATREEEHSTRGRANALRLAMSGQLGDGLTDKRLLSVLDLCLSCKACKSECPSNVDMAKLKGEVLQRNYDRHGISLRDRLIRESADKASFASGIAASLINSIQRSGPFRAALEKTAGFDKRRILPDFARKTFVSWYKSNYKAHANPAQKVVLFVDTYLNHYEPNVGIAATQLLHGSGYEVLLGDVGCCQRPKISHGFLRDAKNAGGETVLALDQFLQEDIPVLVCEPSCASALNDDLPDLIEDEALAGRLQNGVMMIEDFLHQEIEAGRLTPNWRSDTEKIKLHGHCHKKALVGLAPLENVLSNVSGLTRETLPSGCCGMAGSFGYEKEHYEISEKIGEQILFPAVKAADKNTGIIANGFSCRHQIAHFTGKQAHHWVELVKNSEQ